MKQLLDYFSRLGSKYHLNFSGQEILKDCILGFDGVNKKLLLLSGIGQGLYREQVIDLNEVSRCSVKKYYGRIKANALATASLDQYLEKMEVQMDFHNNKEAVVIPFYKPASSTLNELPQLEQKANQWMQELSIDKEFPAQHKDMLQLCRDKNQIHPTVLILKYGVNGFNTLHQDLYGEVYFPMQIVFVLNDEFTGGEFVITEQIPRAQSKANVLQPGRGDMLIVTTNFRPVRGTKGYYRVNMKHGVSPLHSGERYSLGIIFHDALN